MRSEIWERGPVSRFLPACDIGTAGEDRTKSLHAFTALVQGIFSRQNRWPTVRNATDAILPCHSVVGTGEQGDKYSQTLGFIDQMMLSQKSKYALKPLLVLSQEYGKG